MLSILKKKISMLVKRINANGGIFGCFLIKDHFYHPIPHSNKLFKNEHFFNYQYLPPGFNLRVEEQKKLLSNLSTIGFNTSSVPKIGYYYTENGMFGYADSAAYFAIIKLFKPKKIIEIGAGNSTLVATMASTDSVQKTEITAIEPYPSDTLLKLSNKVRIVKKQVETLPLEFFDSLEANDILFIDSSHVIKTKNDVVYLYLEVLPRLKSGVLIQIHDISIPYEVHPAILREGFYWTEQYLLLAMLTHTTRYEILYAGYFMNKDHFDEVRKAFPEVIAGKCGGSFWLKIN